MREKRMKLDKTTLIAQGFFSCLAVVIFVFQKYLFPKAKLSSTWQKSGGGVCACSTQVCTHRHREHRKHIVGQTQNNTADCFPLTKKVWFLIVNQGRFTACGFKRLETEAFLRESAARWADSRNVIRIIQLYKARGGRKEKEIKSGKKKIKKNP